MRLMGPDSDRLAWGQVFDGMTIWRVPHALSLIKTGYLIMKTFLLVSSLVQS